MKTKIWILSFAVLALGFAAGRLASQEGMDPQELMRKMMEAGQPGPEHDFLETMEGDWEQTVTLWQQPGATPMKSKGTATSEMVLDGRFLHSTGECSMMGVNAERIEYLGFDRRHDEFFSYAMDTLGTYAVTARGTRDESGKIVMNGEDKDFIGMQKYRIEIDVKSEDEFVYSIIFTELGPMKYADGFKMVEVVSKRKS